MVGRWPSFRKMDSRLGSCSEESGALRRGGAASSWLRNDPRGKPGAFCGGQCNDARGIWDATGEKSLDR